MNAILKTFKIYSIVILLLISPSLVFSQDEVYNEKVIPKIVLDANKITQAKKLKVEKSDSLQNDSLKPPIKFNDVNDYTTEKDYTAQNYSEDEYVISKEEMQEEERLKNDKKQENKETRNAILGAVIEVAIEVFVNVLFVFSLGN